MQVNTPTEFVNRLRSIFYIMVGIPLIFFVILYLKFRQSGLHGFDADIEPIFLYVIPMICIGDAIFAYILYNRKLKMARQRNELIEKLEILFKGNLLKFALLEGSTILALVIYYLTSHILYAGIYIVMLILFAMSNPTVYSIINDLKLPKEQSNAMKQDIPF